MVRRKVPFTAAFVAMATSAVLALSAMPAGASAPGVTSNTITLGLITSLTGPAASEYTGIVPAAQARVDLQNAKGGIDGRKIKLIVEDDGTNPTNNGTASSALLSKGVFGVINESAVAYGGYKILQQAGVPVTGGAYDGPEWNEQPNTNMFSISGPGDPKDPAYTNSANFVKAHGGTACGAVGYAISPSSIAAASGFLLACTKDGLKNAYFNNSLPFGSVNATTLALQLKAAGVDSLYLPLDENTNFAIMTALKQDGMNMKVVLNATGYGQDLITDTPAIAAAQGAWFSPAGTPVGLKTPATKAFQAALAKYAHYTGIPDFSWYEGWGGVDLMIEGLSVAGKNPTQSGFIKALHKVTNYDMGGLGSPVNFSLSHFGKAASTLCGYLTQFEGDAFVHPTKVCGTIIPNSDQIPSA
jgi:branched-chain amino acid transport system substrate-binding protein